MFPVWNSAPTHTDTANTHCMFFRLPQEWTACYWFPQRWEQYHVNYFNHLVQPMVQASSTPNRFVPVRPSGHGNKVQLILRDLTRGVEMTLDLIQLDSGWFLKTIGTKWIENEAVVFDSGMKNDLKPTRRERVFSVMPAQPFNSDVCAVVRYGKRMLNEARRINDY